MILIYFIINMITIKNGGEENNVRKEGKWWGCYDEVREEE